MSRFERVPIEEVRAFWDRRPCNIRHSRRAVGSREYFDEVEARKYFVEPHILRFADFSRWRGRRVLEIGCGIGTDAVNFARHGAYVTAVDLSAESLALARQRAETYEVADRIVFCEANAEKLEDFLPVQPYDLVYSFGVIHHTPHPAWVLGQAHRYVAPGGMLKIMVYNRYSWKALLLVVSVARRGRFRDMGRAIAWYSEAQMGSPVTYTWTRRSVRKMLAQQGFCTTELYAEHIFPWRVRDYLDHRYVKACPFRWLPRPVFRALERCIGWHLCATAARVERP